MTRTASSLARTRPITLDAVFHEAGSRGTGSVGHSGHGGSQSEHLQAKSRPHEVCTIQAVRQPLSHRVASTSQRWIDTLRLRPHPEGGWFREVYKATETIPHASLPTRFTGSRSHSTAIYFLLNGTDYSALHTIKQDEVWHFYDGETLTLHLFDPKGLYSTVTLGQKLKNGEVPMAVVKAGWLFGATVEPTSYALVGCTVAPGFDFEDLDMPRRAVLVERYPQHREIVERLTRVSGPTK